MVKVGDRIRLSSLKGPDREGVVRLRSSTIHSTGRSSRRRSVNSRIRSRRRCIVRGPAGEEPV